MRALAALCVTLLALYFVPTAVVRSFDHESKLGLFEDSIQGVSSEMMRRSPALKKNFENFRTCIKHAGCDTKPIFAERDRIIKETWPQVFDRVAVDKDWVDLVDYVLPSNKVTSAEAGRMAFFDELKQHGKEKLRNQCVPNTTYRYSRREDAATYDTKGYTCPTKPELKRSG